MRELSDLSMLETRQLDFAVSFGAGQFLGVDQTRSRRWLHYAIPEWVQRVTCCLGGALDADSMYDRFFSTIDGAEKSKHHRVRPVFKGAAAASDDPKSIVNLKDETVRYMKLRNTAEKVRRIRLAMLATCFYGALLSPPTFNSRIGQYSVQLVILSRWPEDKNIEDSLTEKLSTASFVVNGRPFPYAVWLECTIFIPNLDVPIDICLKLGNVTSHPISGFPLSIRQMIYLQPPPVRKRGATGHAERPAKRQRSV